MSRFAKLKNITKPIKTKNTVWSTKVFSSHCGASTGQERLGQRNGMIFCTHGICVWIIEPVPWNFFRVEELHDSIREVCFLHCRFTCFFFPCRTLSAENTCVESSSNISSPRAPTTNSGHKTENFLQVQSSRQVVRWDVLLPTFLNFFCSMAKLLPHCLRDACKSYSHWYVRTIFFPASAFTLGAPTGVRVDSTWLQVK